VNVGVGGVPVGVDVGVGGVLVAGVDVGVGVGVCVGGVLVAGVNEGGDVVDVGVGVGVLVGGSPPGTQARPVRACVRVPVEDRADWVDCPAEPLITAGR